MKKKLFAMLAAAVMACCALTAPVSAAESYIPGDVNLDGVVDLADAILVLKDYTEQIVDLDGILTPEQRQIGDLDGDYTYLWFPDSERYIVADVRDAMHILQYYVSSTIDPEMTMEDVLGHAPKVYDAINEWYQKYTFIWYFDQDHNIVYSIVER